MLIVMTVIYISSHFIHIVIGYHCIMVVILNVKELYMLYYIIHVCTHYSITIFM